jgi:NAD(P)-dependent dehydrogenase (short-subunit alcohol dehydrogenase family)
VTEISLAGMTIVVTGGSMGIGYSCAEEIVRRGGSVVLCARGRTELEAAGVRLSTLPRARVLVAQGDVTSAEDIERVLDVATRLGSLSGIVHAAGVYGPIGPVVKVDAAAWFDAIRVNLFGTFQVARAACQRMIETGVRGSVVLLSGGGAASPFPNYTAYACGKVGVVRLAETLAQEVAEYGIRVNAMAPGFVATRLHDQTLAVGAALAGSFLEKTKSQLAEGGVPPSVAARTAAFLLSAHAAGITGRFVAAPYDDWERWPDRLATISGSDLFTLRRIVPRDRGMDWQ